METVEPIFNVGPESFVVAVWYLQGEGGDWMAMLERKPDGFHFGTYRFRWYRDDKAFDSDDVKSITHLGPVSPLLKSEAQLIESLDKAAQLLRDGGYCGKHRNPLWRRIIRGGPEEFAAAIMSAPFVHAQTFRGGGAA